MGGGSAGAGTSLWLGTHDDMADPAAEDPVARESSRLRAAGAIETQATYDLRDWDVIFAPYGITLELAAMAGFEQRILSFYGIDSLSQLDEDPDIIAYRAEVDMLELMDAGDAKIWLSSTVEEEAAPLDAGALFHHPYHAQAVMDRADEVGLEQVSYIPVLGVEDPNGVGLVDFFLAALQ